METSEEESVLVTARLSTEVIELLATRYVVIVERANDNFIFKLYAK